MLLYRVCWTLSCLFRWHMVSSFWMCSLSFKLYGHIWQVLEDLLHSLHLLMMSHDCPLTIHHKKREYICMLIGGVFCFGARLYLEAWAKCILFWLLMYLFFSFDVFIIYGLYMLGGDTMFYVSFIISCFTYDTLVIDLYYEVIHGICLILCFVKSRIYFVLLVFSTHAFMCLLSVSGIYRLIQSCYCLHGNW